MSDSSNNNIISGAIVTNNSNAQSDLSATVDSNINSANVNLHMNRGLVITGDAYVYDGEVANNMTITSGTQFVSGGVAINTIVISGNQFVSKGTVDTTTINVGNQSVISGGTASNTSIINGSQYVGGGNVFNTTINSGSQGIAGGNVVITNITSGNQLVEGGTVYNTSIGSGKQWIYSGNIYSTTLGNVEQIISGGTVVNTIFGSGGRQEVNAGTVSNTTLSNNASQVVFGGSVIDTTFIGGLQTVIGGTVSNTSIISGTQDLRGGTVLNTTLTSGDQYAVGAFISYTSIGSGQQYVSTGTVISTIINSGTQYVSGGVVSNTNINYGTQSIVGGTVYNTTISNGSQEIQGGGAISGTTYLYQNASQVIMSGANLNNVVISAGAVNDAGIQIVSSGATLNNVTLGSQISQTVLSGANINSVTLQNAAVQNVSGGTVNNISINTASQYVYGGAVSNVNMVNGYQVVSGGNVTGTNISNGTQAILGGTVVNTSLNNGVQVVSAGSVTNTSITSGTQYVTGGSVNSTYFTGGVQNVSSGIVYNTSLTNNASQFVFSGAIASNTVISGGYQSIYSGAVASDTTVTDGSVYVGNGANLGNVTINNGGYLDVSVKTNIQGAVTLNQGGSAQLTTSNGGAINLVGNYNGGLTIIGDPSIIGNDQNTSVTTQIQGFSGVDAGHSDSISLQYDALQNNKLSNVTFPDNNHITITMDNGFSLTLNIVGIKQTGYSIQSSSDGASGLVLTVCFLSGTQIKTKLGVKNIEELQTGDFVTTYDWAQKKYIEREVTWVGKKYCRVNKSLPDDMAGYPVRIVKDAIAKNIPYKDLLVTAEHCLFFEDKFIPARMLVNGSTIYYDYAITSYEYYHLETQDHAVIIADGVCTESYLDTGNRHAFNHNQKIIETSFQSAKDWTIDAAAPLVVARDVVEPLYNKLNKRAQRLKADYKGRHVQLVEDSDLHLVTDQGQVIRNKRVSGDWVTFMVPSTAEFVWINSNRSRPCDVVGPFVDNRHFLGVLVGEIMVFADNKNEFLNILREEEMLEGWHAKQKQAGRWTKGRALLPIKSKHLVDNSVIYISLQILSEGPYIELVTEEEITLVS